MSDDLEQQEPDDETFTAFADFLRRREREPSASFDDFCRLRPDVAVGLRALHLRWEEATALMQRIGSGPSLADRLKLTYGDSIDLDISLSGDDDTSFSSSQMMQRLSSSGSSSKSYKSKGLVARGGMGAILRVWDEDLRRTLAMKVVLGHDEEPEQDGTPRIGEHQLVRFLEEAQITGQLDHPGILPVHDLGLDESGRVFFTMPLVRGQTLKEILDLARDNREGWTTTRVLGVLIKVCEAMAFAHSKGVIHRDLKPANIMVGRFGETYVMDWGLAKVLGRKETKAARRRTDVGSSMSLVRTDRKDASDSDPDSPLITMDGDVVGTPTYMAPEQAMGHLDELGPPSDVYAVGSMLYHLLTHGAPYHQAGVKMSLHTVLAKVLDGPPAPIDDKSIPSELVAICNKAMARNPEERYSDMLAIAGDMRAFVEGHVVRAYETGAAAELKKWVSRNRIAATFMAVSVVVVIAALAVYFYVQTQSRAKLEEQYAAVRSANATISAERDRAEQQEAEAELQRSRAEAIAERSRREGYVGNVRAADSSLKLLRATEANERLAACEEALRGWEWHYLARRANGHQTRFEVPMGLTSASVVSGGRLVLCCSADRGLRLWDPELEEFVAGFTDPQITNYPPVFACMSPDGSTIYSLNEGGRLWIWDVRTGGLLDNHFAHRPYAVYGLALTEDGRRLATAGQDVRVLIWNTSTMETERSLPSTELASAIRFSPDGERIAIGHEDGSIRIWSAAAPAESDAPASDVVQVPLLQPSGHSSQVTALDWSPDGAMLASCSRDGTARVWSTTTGEIVTAFAGHEEAVSAIAFHPDGTRVATGAEDDTVRLWDVSSGRRLEVMLGHVAPIHSLGFRKNGAQLVSGSRDNTLRVWNIDRNPVFRRLESDEEIASLAFSPDGRLLATAQSSGAVRLWNTRSGRVLDTLEGHGQEVTCVAFGPKGQRLVTGSTDKSVRLWDTDSSNSLRVWRGHTRRVLAVDYSGDGRWIASAGGGRQIRIWDAQTGVAHALLEGHQGAVNGLDFTPDSGFVASASSDGTVRLWDIESQQFEAFEADGDDQLCVAVSPDASLVASGSKAGLLRVWNTSTGALVHELAGHDDEIVAVVFDEAQSRLVSASSDGTIRVWALLLGTQLLAVEEDAAFRCVAINGNRIAAAGDIQDEDHARADIWLWEPVAK